MGCNVLTRGKPPYTNKIRSKHHVYFSERTKNEWTCPVAFDSSQYPSCARARVPLQTTPGNKHIHSSKRRQCSMHISRIQDTKTTLWLVSNVFRLPYGERWLLSIPKNQSRRRRKSKSICNSKSLWSIRLYKMGKETKTRKIRFTGKHLCTLFILVYSRIHC